MKLEHLCVSLELAKELKEAGYPQESLFYWLRIVLTNDIKWEIYSRHVVQELADPMAVYYAAPTAAEIGEVLPEFIKTEKERYILNLEIVKLHEKWEVSYCWVEDYDNGGFHDLPEVQANTEADARAKMYLYLKKENLI